MRIEGVLFFLVFPHRGECEFRDKNREFYFSVLTLRSEYSDLSLTHRALGRRSDNPVSPGGPRLVDNLGSDTSVR